LTSGPSTRAFGFILSTIAACSVSGFPVVREEHNPRLPYNNEPLRGKLEPAVRQPSVRAGRRGWLIDESGRMGHYGDMLENRKNPRYQTLARARIPVVMEGDNLLKDLSITGCRVECTIYADIKPGGEYMLEIQPESVAKIGSFELPVESKWIRTGGYATEVGFNVVASPKNSRHFQRYVDYLTFRASRT
jgi:hypothetical protein